MKILDDKLVFIEMEICIRMVMIHGFINCLSKWLPQALSATC